MIKRRQKLFNSQEWDEWNKNKNNNSKITQWQMVIVSNGNDRPIQNDDLSSENKTYMMDDSRAKCCCRCCRRNSLKRSRIQGFTKSSTRFHWVFECFGKIRRRHTFFDAEFNGHQNNWYSIRVKRKVERLNSLESRHSSRISCRIKIGISFGILFCINKLKRIT